MPHPADRDNAPLLGTASLGEPASLYRASVDAGYRSYWRTDGAGPASSSWTPPRARRRAAMAAHARSSGARRRARAAGVGADVEAGFLLLEDLGGPTLAQVLDLANADEHFEAAIDPLLKLQSIAPPAEMGEFGEALLQRDAGLFEEWFLGRHLGLALDCED